VERGGSRILAKLRECVAVARLGTSALPTNLELD